MHHPYRGTTGGAEAITAHFRQHLLGNVRVHRDGSIVPGTEAGTEAGKIVIAPPDFDDYLHHRSTADPIGRFSPC